MKNKHYTIILNKTHISISSKTTKTHVPQQYFNISKNQQIREIEYFKLEIK